MKYDYDLFTIGAGSGGVRASRLAAKAGARVAVAEERFLGGTCVNVGCVPKKLYVYAAHISEELAQAAGFGWTVGEGRFDWATLRANKDREIGRLNRVYDRLLHGSGCEVLRGRARLLSPHRVEVRLEGGEVREVTAERVLVATGGHARRPTEPGTERAWISDDVFTAEEMPRRLLVVGGGYIALEMAGIFNGLGAEVTLAYRGPHLLRGFDDDVRFFVTEELRKKGIDVRLNTTVECLEPCPGGVEAMLSYEETVEVDQALYAIGRVPNTKGLGLEELGVQLDEQGAVVVDAHYRTTVPNVWALGDVTNRLNLTPVAIEEAMVLVHNLFGRAEGEEPRTLDYDHVPTAVFSQPAVATVGLSEVRARDTGRAIQVYTSEFRPMKLTLGGGEERTFMKLVVDAKTDRVLGVHVVGPDGPEIIQGFAVALKCGATKAQLDATVGLHPTAAEELVTMRERRPDE
jgi:glutathione reductase (NADPH)